MFFSISFLFVFSWMLSCGSFTLHVLKYGGHVLHCIAGWCTFLSSIGLPEESLKLTSSKQPSLLWYWTYFGQYLDVPSMHVYWNRGLNKWLVWNIAVAWCKCERTCVGWLRCSTVSIIENGDMWCSCKSKDNWLYLFAKWKPGYEKYLRKLSLVKPDVLIK